MLQLALVEAFVHEIHFGLLLPPEALTKAQVVAALLLLRLNIVTVAPAT